jgi:hypothetical protein
MNPRKVRSLLCLIFLIILPVTSFGQVPDGYTWNRLSREAKKMTAAWFFYGYDMGYFDGRNWKRIAKLKDGEEVSAIFDYKDADFYWKEVDSFYQTFPLCKRLALPAMLAELAKVWRGQRSYKEMGDACLELPK